VKIKRNLASQTNKAPKILLFDIETAPNLSYVWGHYEQNVIAHEQESYMLSFAYKWLGDKTVTVRSLPDYKRYKPGDTDDKELVKDLWNLLDQADIVIAHNGDKFDILKANTRFIYHDMEPPQFYRTVDTLKIARNQFKFNSNKLDDLGRYLGVGRKVPHTGASLWFGCMSGDKASWDTMCKYNKQDVSLLERVYLKLRPWAPRHPNLNVFAGKTSDTSCTKCGSSKVIKRGFAYTDVSRAQRYFCNDCRGYSTGKWERNLALSA
jgi:uncharacterized protein YprB with RNaseH-like and TPR domain